MKLESEAHLYQGVDAHQKVILHLPPLPPPPPLPPLLLLPLGVGMAFHIIVNDLDFNNIQR